MLSFFLKIGRRNLFWYNNKIGILFCVIFLAQKSAMKNCSEKSAADVDVLQPLQPILEFMEFDTYIEEAKGNPDYKFKIANISSLLLYNNELRGNKFHVLGLNSAAQIKCSVRYNEFEFFIRFLHPENDETRLKQLEMDKDQLLIITTALVAQNLSNLEGPCRNESHVFRFDQQLLYGTYYPFHKMFYKNKGSSSNSITLHLHLRKVLPPLDHVISTENGKFLWKVDVANFTRWGDRYEFAEGTQLALSPFVSVDKNSFKVQLRLFLRERSCYLEARYVSLSDDDGQEYTMELMAVDPGEASHRTNWYFYLMAKDYNEKSSMVLRLGDYFHFLSYSHENKLYLSLAKAEFF